MGDGATPPPILLYTRQECYVQHIAKARPKSVLTARIIHADGSVTELGVLRRTNWLTRFLGRAVKNGNL